MSKTAVLLCDLADCVTIDFTAGSAYTAGDQVVVGDTPMVIAFTVASGGKATGIIAAPMIQLAASTNCSSGTAAFSVGQGIFWSTGDDGVMAGTGGDSTGTLVGVACASGYKTAGTIVAAFDARIYLAAANAKRA